MTDLLSLIPEGVPVVGVIVVVMIFLRFISTYFNKMEVISDKCHERQKESQDQYQEQIKLLMDNNQKSSEMFVSSMDKLNDAVRILATSK